MLWHSTEESQGQAAFSKSPNLSTAYDLLSITTKGQTPLQSSSHPRARNPKEEVFRWFFSGNKAFGNLFVIFVNDNTCLMSELPFSLGPSYLFVCKEIKIDKQVSSKTKVESCVIVKSHLVRRETCIWESCNEKLIIGYPALLSQWPSVNVKYCA